MTNKAYGEAGSEDRDVRAGKKIRKFTELLEASGSGKNLAGLWLDPDCTYDMDPIGRSERTRQDY